MYVWPVNRMVSTTTSEIAITANDSYLQLYHFTFIPASFDFIIYNPINQFGPKGGSPWNGRIRSYRLDLAPLTGIASHKAQLSSKHRQKEWSAKEPCSTWRPPGKEYLDGFITFWLILRFSINSSLIPPHSFLSISSSAPQIALFT